LNYPFFEDKQLKSFKGLILRADVGGHMSYKNELIYETNKEINSTVAVQAYRQVVLYLNGKYWGLYNLMEKKGKDFIASNYNADTIDLVDASGKPTAGDKDHYKRLLEIVKTEDITNQVVYSKVGKMMDIENFIDFWIYEVYSSKTDSPMNRRKWRPKTDTGKWRWLSYDMDLWQGYNDKTFERYKNYKGQTYFLLLTLFENKDFKAAFLNRLADYLNSILLPQKIDEIINRITSKVASEVPRNYERWNDTMQMVTSKFAISWIKSFSKSRPGFLRKHIVEFFYLDGEFNIQLNVDAAHSGSIKINSITTDTFPWKGKYFMGQPITIEALPKPGYAFAGWSDPQLPTKPKVILNPSSDYNISARFIPVVR
jgi:hypothetical protein